MKSLTRLRRFAPAVRTYHGHVTESGLLSRLAIPVAGAVVLVASALLAGAAYVTAMAVLPTTVPVLLAGWVLAIGLTFALPLVVVRGVVAAFEPRQ